MLDKITTTTTVNISMEVELRDYFAGQALAGLCADPNLIIGPDKTMEQLSYSIADKMLAARKQTDTTQGTP